MKEFDDSVYSVEQFHAVTLPARNVLVSAAAGSGKTRVIEGRACWLMHSEGVKPEEMVFVTFTNAGAKVLRERLAKADPAFGENACNVGHIGTLHSLMLRMLRRVNPEWSVLAPEDALEILLETADGFRDKTPKEYLTVDLRRDWWKESRNLSVSKMKPSHRTMAAYYQRILGAHMLDYDAILWRGLGVAGMFQWRALFVDEFQDSGAIDQAIYDTIKCEHRMYVGDSDQAIYGFRGGTVENILEIAKRPEWTHVQLRTNYRSAVKIVEASQRLIRHNRVRITLASVPDREAIGIVGLEQSDEAYSQSVGIRDRVKEQLARGVPASEIAVLARTHEITRDIAEVLREGGIPVRTQKKSELPVDWKLTRLLLTLLAQPKNWGLGEIVLRKIRGMDRFQIQSIKAEHKSPASYFDIPEAPTVESALNKLGQLGAGTDSILVVRRWIDREQPLDVYELHMGVMGSDETELVGEGVYAGTMHSAKGREWLCVHLAALEETVIPAGDPSEVEEMRRLAYVGVTRARDELWLYCSRSREFHFGHGFYKRRDTGASRFVEELKP